MRAGRLLICIVLCGAAATASAQDANERQIPRLDPKACADADNPAQDDTHESQDEGTSGANLSDKLAQSGGVICPPSNLDPEIRAPAPGGGRTPVIPPPADTEPGAQPK